MSRLLSTQLRGLGAEDVAELQQRGSEGGFLDATEIPRSGDAGRPPDGGAATLGPGAEKVVRAATVGTGVELTFTFGFGNVLTLALRLGVLVWVAPLVAPAVDLSILGLLLGTRHLALTGASSDVLRPARRLLIFASLVTRSERCRASRGGSVREGCL